PRGAKVVAGLGVDEKANRPPVPREGHSDSGPVRAGQGIAPEGPLIVCADEKTSIQARKATDSITLAMRRECEQASPVGAALPHSGYLSNRRATTPAPSAMV